MEDPIDVFFGVDTGSSPMGVVEQAAIIDDVTLVRDSLRDAIQKTSAAIPDVVQLAIQMQEPEMIDSASKLVTALSKIGSDLIAIDLKVLAESKKQPPPAPAVTPAEGSGESTPAFIGNGSDVLEMLREIKSKQRVYTDGTD